MSAEALLAHEVKDIRHEAFMLGTSENRWLVVRLIESLVPPPSVDAVEAALADREEEKT